MIKRLIILAFIATVGANSVGAVSPQMDGDRCVMSCCRKAQQPGRDVEPARLRCLVNCSQPAGTSPSPATGLTSSQQKKANTNACLVSRPETISYIQHTRFPKSPTRSISGCSNRYLEIGALLI
ncbi:MAG: hypothetical protein WAU45_18225 [Blastocatellia bacterium]